MPTWTTCWSSVGPRSAGARKSAPWEARGTSRPRSSISRFAGAIARSIRATSSPAKSASVETFPQTAGQVLDELPSDAAGTAASCHRPLDRLSLDLLRWDFQPIAVGVTFDHREEGLLVAVVESQP